MRELIKQILKSFKSYALILIALFFVFIITLFSITSFSYFFINVKKSYDFVYQNANSGNAIVNTEENNLTSKIEYDLDLSNLRKTPNTPFKNLSAYNDLKTSFAYQPKPLYHIPIGTKNKNVFAFAYYSQQDQNPYFQSEGINSETSLYTTRAKGILKSYGALPIPSDKTKWRALGLEFTNTTPEKILYQINPLTGEQLISNNELVLNGYFNEGNVTDLELSVGNLRYPNQEEANKQFINNQTKTPLPFFAALRTVNNQFDFSQFPINQTLEYLQKYRLSNVLASTFQNIRYFLKLQNINWNLAQLNPFYEYLKAFVNLKNVNLGGEENDYDYVFSITWKQEEPLPPLQKETLAYVRKKYGEEIYAQLVKFNYYVKASWIKQVLKDELGKDNIEEQQRLAKNKFSTLSDLDTKYKNNNKTDLNGWSVITNWLKVYISNIEKQKNLQFYQYQKEYLASKLKEKGFAFEQQNSFILNDYATDQIFLINQKTKADVNKLLVFDGVDFTKIAKTPNLSFLLQTIKNESATFTELNPNGEYLINLVSFLQKAHLSNVAKTDADYHTAKNLADKIIDNYEKTAGILANDYYHFFAIMTPYYNSANFFTTNNQNLGININFNFGHNFSEDLKIAAINQPYNHTVVVNQKWLSTHKKKQLPIAEWKKVIDYDLSSFLEYKDSLADDYKIKVGTLDFIIIGTGQSSETVFPIISLDKPIPDFNNETLLFLNQEAYEALLHVNNVIPTNYFIVQTNSSSTSFNQLTALFEPYNLKQKPFRSNDTSRNRNIITLRNSIPMLINNYVSLLVWVFVAILLFVIFYLNYLLIKIYVQKNQVTLAIAKANGFKSSKIIFALSIYHFIIAFLSSLIAYISSYFFQPWFFGKINDYWFIPIIFSNFSFFYLFLMILGSYLLCLGCIAFGVFRFFKTPVNSLLTQDKDFKINHFLQLFKFWKIKYVFFKFNLSLTFAKLIRFGLLSAFTTLIIFLVASLTTLGFKFTISQKNTTYVKQFNYNFDFVTPTLQGGLYKTQQYRFLGTSDKTLGIYPIYETFKPTLQWPFDPYYALWHNGDRDLFALRNKEGKVRTDFVNNQKRYFTNFLLPSVSTYDFFENEPNFFRNVVVSKWLLDITFNLPNFSINIWNFLVQNLPVEIINRINQLSQNFVRNILADPILQKFNDNNNHPFIDPQTLVLRYENVFTSLNLTNLYSLRFNDAFLKFIGIVYGDDRIASLDAKFAFGIIPIMDNNEIEPYTYIDANINDIQQIENAQLPKLNPITISSYLNNGKRNLENISGIKIYGIKKDSDFVNLINENGKNLFQLKNQNNQFLFQTKIKDKSQDNTFYYPIVINAAVAYKYNLRVKSRFYISALNTYDRYLNAFLTNIKTLSTNAKPVIDTTNNTYPVEVIGISADALGESFYIDQNFANEILRLSFAKGGFLFGDFFNQSMYDFEHDKLISKEMYTNIILGDNKSQERVIPNSTDKIQTLILPPPSGYIPFNGVFSKENNSLFFKSLFFYAQSGVYNFFKEFNSKDNTASKLFKTLSPAIINLIIPQNKKIDLFKQALNLKQDMSRNDFIMHLYSKENISEKKIQDYLGQIFSDNNLQSLRHFDSFKTVYQNFNKIFNSSNDVKNIILAIFVPTTILLILALNFVMLDDFCKIIFILKTLGFSYQQNLASFLIIFLPAILFAFLTSFFLLFGFIHLLQFLVFRLLTIFITRFIHWGAFFIGLAFALAIMCFNFIYVAFYLRKQKLKNIIENTN